MSDTQTQMTQPVNARQMTEEELEAQAIKWCEEKGRALDRKKSWYMPNRRHRYVNRQ